MIQSISLVKGNLSGSIRWLPHCLFLLIFVLVIASSTEGNEQESTQTGHDNFNKLSVQNPDSLLKFAVEHLLKKHQVEYSIELLQQVIALNPNSSQAHYYLGLAYAIKHQWKSATAVLRRLISSSMSQGIFLNAAKFQLGKIFIQEMAQTEEAVPLLVDVLQSQPDNIEARLLLSQAYMQLGHNTELFALLNPVTHTNDIDQNIIQALMLVGKALFSDMEYVKALGYFERVVINRPFEANAYFHLANCYFRLKRIAEGKQMLQTFEQRRQEREELAPLKRMVGESGEDMPNNAKLEAWLQIAQLELKRENWSVAETAFRQLIALAAPNPENNRHDYIIILAGESLAKIHIQKGEYDQAESIYQSLLQANDQQAKHWNNLGYTQVMQRKFEQAQQSFQTAIQIEPNNTSFRLNLSKVEQRINDALD